MAQIYEISLSILLLSMKGSHNPQFQPNVCLLSLKQQDKYHFCPICPKKRGSQITTVCGHFLCFCEETSDYIISS